VPRTRGTSKDRYARYSEEGAVYADNMQRLLRKFETAKQLVPPPVRRTADQPTRFGAIYFGSTSPAMCEALDMLKQQGIHIDTLRIRGFPFHTEVTDFIAQHEKVVVVEQNRDSQLRTLLVAEGAVDPARLVPVLHYDGTPITARFIVHEIANRIAGFNVVLLKKATQ
jgi:2-oxoglutarate/2-oxoacid ferredoxin oxidoreductase subunit alpha